MSFSTRVLALVVLTLAAPACKKAGSNAPGGAGGKGLTVEESDKKRTAAQQDAKARTLVGLANEDLSKGRWVSARERAKRALEAEPNNADAFAVLGAANWRAGDYDGSTKAFKEALELDAKNFGAAVGLGRNYQAAGDHKSAIELQDKILAGDPNQLDPLLCKLWSYYAMADADNAVKLTIDTRAPVALRFSPAEGAGQVSIDTDIVLGFSEALKRRDERADKPLLTCVFGHSFYAPRPGPVVVPRHRPHFLDLPAGAGSRCPGDW